MSLKRNLSYSVIAKIVSLLSQTLIMTVLCRFLNDNEFALFALLLQLSFFFSLIDFGWMGGAFQNELSRLSLEPSSQKAPSLFFHVFGRSLCLYLVAFLLLLPFLPRIFLSLFKTTTPLFTLYTAFICLKIPFSIQSAGWIAYQQGYCKSLLEIFESLLLLGIAFSCYIFSSSFSTLLISYTLIPTLLQIGSFFYFLKIRKWLNILRFFKAPLTLQKRSLRLTFWLQNLTSLLLFASPPFFVSKYISLQSAGHFLLSFKLISLCVGIHIALLHPLTPYFTKKLAVLDLRWIKKTLVLSTIGSLVFFAASSCLLLCLANPFLNLWTSKQILFNPQLLVWMTLYGMINLFSIFLNALDLIYKQLASLVFGVLFLFSMNFLFKKNLTVPTIISFMTLSLVALLLSNVYETLKLLDDKQKKASYIDY